MEGTEEACGSICKTLFKDMVIKQAWVDINNSYNTGKMKE